MGPSRGTDGKGLLGVEQPSHSLEEALIALRHGKAIGVELAWAGAVGCPRIPAPRLPPVALGTRMLAEGGLHHVGQRSLSRLFGHLVVPGRYLDAGQVSPRVALLLSPVAQREGEHPQRSPLVLGQSGLGVDGILYIAEGCTLP
jgi:hypothetical protein